MTATTIRIGWSALVVLSIAALSPAQEVTLPLGSRLGAVGDQTFALANTSYVSDGVSDEYFEVRSESEPKPSATVTQSPSVWGDYLFFAALAGLSGLGLLISASCIYVQRHPRVPKLLV